MDTSIEALDSRKFDDHLVVAPSSNESVKFKYEGKGFMWPCTQGGRRHCCSYTCPQSFYVHEVECPYVLTLNQRLTEVVYHIKLKSNRNCSSP